MLPGGSLGLTWTCERRSDQHQEQAVDNAQLLFCPELTRGRKLKVCLPWA